MPSAQGLIFLKEHEFGFHPTTLGFPSIDACRAIIYQTQSGLFGWHQAGGAYLDRLATYGNKLGSYVRAHPNGASAGLGLYVVTHVGCRGTYGGIPGTPSGNAQAGREHLTEMAAYAQALGFTGTIKSFDLSNRWPGGSCYVEFVANGTACDVYGNAWAPAGNNTANYDPARGYNHQNGHGKSFKDPKFMFTDVINTGRTKLDMLVI